MHYYIAEAVGELGREIDDWQTCSCVAWPWQ